MCVSVLFVLSVIYWHVSITNHCASGLIKFEYLFLYVIAYICEVYLQ